MERGIRALQKRRGESESPGKIPFLMFRRYLRLVRHLSILYLRNVTITEDIFKMFRTFRIHSWDTLSKTFWVINPSILIFLVFVCLFIFSFLFLEGWGCINNSPWSYCLWGADLCSYMVFCILFVLKRRCPYIQWICLFSILELI